MEWKSRLRMVRCIWQLSDGVVDGVVVDNMVMEVWQWWSNGRAMAG